MRLQRQGPAAVAPQETCREAIHKLLQGELRQSDVMPLQILQIIDLDGLQEEQGLSLLAQPGSPTDSADVRNGDASEQGRRPPGMEAERIQR